MIQKDNFRYAEKCLYNYKKNLACLDVLKEDLRVERACTDVHAQNYQYSFGFTGDPSNPLQNRIIKIENIEERIKILERCTKPITQLITDLNAPENLEGSENKILLDILKYMYLGKNFPDAIIQELHITRRTFARRRRDLIYMVIDYLVL